MQENFQLLKDITYLNNGTHSLMPISVLKAQHQYIDEFEQNPTHGLFQAWERLWHVQKRLAEFYFSNPVDLFLRTNVTQPLNEFILGVQMSERDEILTTDQEYGAVWNMCRFKAEISGCSVRKLSLPNRSQIQKMTKQKLVDLVVMALRPQTKMLVLSEIYSGHGLVLPILEIAEVTRAKNVLLVVDGAHSPGYLPLDFRQFKNVDFYAGNLHKWFMGPKGTGFGWINPGSKDLLTLLQAGWGTYPGNDAFKKFADNDHDALKRLMLGCHNFSCFYALNETLDFWNNMGPDKILHRIRELGKLVIKLGQEKLDLFHFGTDEEEITGPLHAFLLPDKWQKGSYVKLMGDILSQAKTQVSVTDVNGEKYLRLSPHIYNSESDIEAALVRIHRFLTG